MAIKLKTAPATEPVTLIEAKAHLRVTSTDDDALITSLITAARQYCEAFQNRSYIEQTWELWLDSFPPQSYIKLPQPPLLSVTSVKYYDVDDIVATFSSGDYFVDIKSEPGWIVLNTGCSWPSTTLRPANGVCVEYQAGYATVPEKFVAAIKLMIGHLYENREAISISDLKEVPLAVSSLLWQDRIL